MNFFATRIAPTCWPASQFLLFFYSSSMLVRSSPVTWAYLAKCPAWGFDSGMGDGKKKHGLGLICGNRRYLFVMGVMWNASSSSVLCWWGQCWWWGYSPESGDPAAEMPLSLPILCTFSNFPVYATSYLVSFQNISFLSKLARGHFSLQLITGNTWIVLTVCEALF